MMDIGQATQSRTTNQPQDGQGGAIIGSLPADFRGQPRRRRPASRSGRVRPKLYASQISTMRPVWRQRACLDTESRQEGKSIIPNCQPGIAYCVCVCVSVCDVRQRAISPAG